MCHSVNDKKVMPHEGLERIYNIRARNAISPVTRKAEAENFCPGATHREREKVFFALVVFSKRAASGLGNNIQRSVCELMVSGCV